MLCTLFENKQINSKTSFFYSLLAYRKHSFMKIVHFQSWRQLQTSHIYITQICISNSNNKKLYFEIKNTQAIVVYLKL